MLYEHIQINTTMSSPKSLFKEYKNKTQVVEYTNKSIAKKGALGTLYLGGNENNTKSYTLTLAGRYTS